MNQLQILTLLGKVDRRVLKRMAKTLSVEKDNTWFFVDYVSEEIKVGQSFDVLLYGTEKKLIPETINIKIKEVLDQFGNKLAAIPKGFQTICNFQFSRAIPKEINNLPSSQDWEYNPHSVTLAKHQSIQLSEPDFILASMNKIFIIHIKNELKARNTSFSRPEIIKFLKTSYKAKNATDVENLLNKWKILGLVEEKQNEEIELVP